MPKIKLQSSDGELFTVDAEIAKMFAIIETMVEGDVLVSRADVFSCGGGKKNVW